jgi:hypothetical protein
VPGSAHALFYAKTCTTESQYQPWRLGRDQASAFRLSSNADRQTEGDREAALTKSGGEVTEDPLSRVPAELYRAGAQNYSH